MVVETGAGGSLAGTGRDKEPDEVVRRRVAASALERADSNVVDCESEDGPIGSLAGIAGRARGPADCDLAEVCLGFMFVFVLGGGCEDGLSPVSSGFVWAVGTDSGSALLPTVGGRELVSARLAGLGSFSTASVVGGGVGAMPGGEGGRDFFFGRIGFCFKGGNEGCSTDWIFDA